MPVDEGHARRTAACPVVQTDPDGDGIFGGADLCPAANGNGALNGCPGGVVPVAPAGGDGGATGQPPGALPAVALSGRAGLSRGALLRRSALAKGLVVKVSCSRNAAATLSLNVAVKIARKLKLKVPKRAKSVPIAAGRGACLATGGVKVRLALSKAARRKVLKAKGRLAATLTLRLSAPGAAAATTSTSVKVG